MLVGTVKYPSLITMTSRTPTEKRWWRAPRASPAAPCATAVTLSFGAPNPHTAAAPPDRNNERRLTLGARSTEVSGRERQLDCGVPQRNYIHCQTIRCRTQPRRYSCIATRSHGEGSAPLIKICLYWQEPRRGTRTRLSLLVGRFDSQPRGDWPTFRSDGRTERL